MKPSVVSCFIHTATPDIAFNCPSRVSLKKEVHMCPVMELPGLSTTSVLCPLSPECLSWPCIVSSQVFIDKFMLLILPLLPVLSRDSSGLQYKVKPQWVGPTELSSYFLEVFPPYPSCAPGPRIAHAGLTPQTQAGFALLRISFPE